MASAALFPPVATGTRSRRLPLAYRLVVASALMLAALLVVAHLRDFLAEGVPFGLANKDFANYWVAAHLAADGRAGDVFAPQLIYFAHLRAMMGPDFPWHNWSYPPHYLLLMMPLALVGYKAGILLFLGTTGLLFVSGVTAYIGRPDRLALAAVAPLAVLQCWTVQNGFLTSGLMLWFLALRDRRAIAAGICLGLLTIKPQLCLLLPLLPLMERQWNVLAAAVATAAVLVLASALAFGTAVWTGFLWEVLPYQKQVMMTLGGVFLWMVPSTFGAARMLGLDDVLALRLHLLLAAPVLLATTTALWRRWGERSADYLLPVALFLVTPYALNYDMGVVSAALALFIRREQHAGRHFSAAEQALLACGMLLPAAMMILARSHIVSAPIVLLALFALMLSRSRRSASSKRPGSPPTAHSPG